MKAFEDNLKQQTNKFTRRWSSTLGLLNFLEQNKDRPTRFAGANEDQQVQAAKSKCSDPNDEKLSKYEGPMRSLVRVWGTNKDYVPAPAKGGVVTVVQGRTLIDRANAHHDKWKTIVITDRPTGRYNNLGQPIYDTSHVTKEQSAQVEHDGSAAAGTALRGKPGNHQALPEYWLHLGKIVLDHKTGRCFSCAAAAAYLLIQDASFDQKTIEVVGSKGYDHYIVVVGRSGGANGRIKLGKPAYEYADIGPASGWGADAIAVDVWEANRSGEGLPAVPATKNRYTMEENGQYVLFCSMAPANRQAHKGV